MNIKLLELYVASCFLLACSRDNTKYFYDFEIVSADIDLVNGNWDKCFNKV